MPGGDRTGPAGAGPASGRAAGICAGYAAPGYMNRGFGGGAGRKRGFGPGRFAGRGFGRFGGYGAVPFYREEDEAALLKRESQMLEKELEYIKTRLGEIGKNK